MTRRIGVPEVKRVSIKKAPMMMTPPKMGMMGSPSPSIKRAGAGPELDQRPIKPVQGIAGERESGSKVNTYHGLNVNAHVRMK